MRGYAVNLFIIMFFYPTTETCFSCTICANNYKLLKIKFHIFNFSLFRR